MRKRGGVLKFAWKLFALPFLLFLLTPLIAIFLKLSPVDFFSSFQQDMVLQALRTSLVTSAAALGLTLVFGTPMAYLIYRRRSRLDRMLDTLIDLPTVLPPSVAGVALLMAFGRQGLIGQWLLPLGITIPFSPMAVVMAQMFVSAPLYIRSAAVGFHSVDCELKKAAALDGAGRWDIFRYIMLPMALPNLASGAITCWARSIGEFGATIIFAGNFPGRTQTMPLAIYLGFEINMSAALSLSALLIIVSFTLMFLVKKTVNTPRLNSVDDDDDL